MNPNDIFWLARYVHNEVAPLVRADDRLIIHLNVTATPTQGIDIWLHKKTNGAVTAFKTGVQTKEQVDAFVSRLEKDAAALQPLEVGIAA